MRSKNQLFYHESEKKPVVPQEPTPEIKKSNWKDKYREPIKQSPFRLEDSADDSELNRMVQLRNFDNTDIIEGKPGRLYYDKANKKVKIYISDADGWADLDYTL